MTNETLFFACGIVLAISAVAISFVGLKSKGFPGRAFPLVILWFVVLVGGATTYSVLHAQDEEHHKEAELEQAGHEFEAEDNDDAAGAEAAPEGEDGVEGDEAPSDGPGGSEGGEAKGSSSTIQLAADPSAIAYDTASLTAKAGEVTIDFSNPAPVGHDVAIEKDGEEIAATEVITDANASVKADLEPGTYTFLCTVPGHAEAGMEGTLTVE
jgi:plastocyanin